MNIEFALVGLGIDALIGVFAYFAKTDDEELLKKLENISIIPDQKSLDKFITDERPSRCVCLTGKLVGLEDHNKPSKIPKEALAWRLSHTEHGRQYNTTSQTWSSAKKPIYVADRLIFDCGVSRDVKVADGWGVGKLVPFRQEILEIRNIDCIPGFNSLYKLIGESTNTISTPSSLPTPPPDGYPHYIPHSIRTLEEAVFSGSIVTVFGQVSKRAGHYILTEPSSNSGVYTITPLTKEEFTHSVNSRLLLTRGIFRVCVAIGIGLGVYCLYHYMKDKFPGNRKGKRQRGRGQSVFPRPWGDVGMSNNREDDDSDDSDSDDEPRQPHLRELEAP